MIFAKKGERIFPLLIVTLVNLSGCASYTPVENPHPAAFLHISGNVVPRLDLAIVATYVTTEKGCEQLNFGPGTYSGQLHSITIPVQRSTDSYEVDVPLDRFQAGHCNWQPYSVGYQLSSGDWNTVMANLAFIYTEGLTPKHQIGDGSNVLPTLVIQCIDRGAQNPPFICFENRGIGFNQNAFYIRSEPESLQINLTQSLKRVPSSATTPN
jgi:hypothetical protein